MWYCFEGMGDPGKQLRLVNERSQEKTVWKCSLSCSRDSRTEGVLERSWCFAPCEAHWLKCSLCCIGKFRTIGWTPKTAVGVKWSQFEPSQKVVCAEDGRVAEVELTKPSDTKRSWVSSGCRTLNLLQLDFAFALIWFYLCLVLPSWNRKYIIF